MNEYKPSANVNEGAKAVPANRELKIKAAPPETTEKLTTKKFIDYASDFHDDFMMTSR